MKRDWHKKGAALLHEIESTQPAPHTVAAWYLGQVGYIFKSRTAIVAVDPFLNDLTDENGFSLRLYDIPFAPEALRPDLVICTHGHADHMAIPTLRAIASSSPKTRFLVPGACIEVLVKEARINRDRVVPMTAKQLITFPEAEILPVQAAHPIHETDMLGRDTALCLGITMDGVHITHIGDTYLTDQLLSDLKALPRPDVFFPPINGGDYFRTARNCIGNTNAAEAAKLAVILGAGISVPTHFDLIDGNTCEPFDFVRFLWEEDPAARFRIPALGELLQFTARCE